MKTIMTTIAALLALATPTLAQTVMDTDGDGNVSLEEAQAAYPALTEATFGTMDADGDGVLDAAEVQAAADAGMLPS